LKPIAVEWLDSTSHCDEPWQSFEDLKAAARMTTCFTVGHLFCEDAVSVTVALSYWGDSDDGQVGAAITIPRRSIVRVQDLTVAFSTLAA